MAYKKPNIESVHFSSFVESLPELEGKTFVVTGTTSGTGRVAARVLEIKVHRRVHFSMQWHVTIS